MSAAPSPLIVARDREITTLTLASPGSANALDRAMVEALHEAVDSAAAHGSRVLVIEAEGRAFCAGLGLAGLEEETDASLLLRLVRIELLLEKLWYGPLLSVAVVDGPAAGAGADLVMATTVRYATSAASLRFPGSEFGAVLGVRRLAECTTSALAVEVAASGRAIGAEEAERLGIWKFVEDADQDVAERIARPLARRSAETVAALQREASGFGAVPDPMGSLVRSLAGRPGLADRVRELNQRRLRARKTTV
ncbi:MAG: enoyl-CoA hydratase/isomerase family protein [Proteobacteria bacterium]|nr:enoyl-CoA hydratase/isomerase family protein [Pseudomonadota bacterium]